MRKFALPLSSIARQADLSAAAKKEAASRLIEQALIKREMDLSRYPLPELSDAAKSLQSIKADVSQRNCVS